MNKSVYLGSSMLELSKNHKLYSNWLCKTKICWKSKVVSCKSKVNFSVYIKTNDIYKDIEEDVGTRFDTSNYELDIPLPKGKNKKVIELMSYELVGEIMIKFVGLKSKLYCCK